MMVKYQSEALDRVFSALADPTRRAIIARLASGPVSVGELARPFAISLPAISRHLRTLEDAGLLVQRRDGRVRRCILVTSPLDDVAEWIEAHRAFWESQFDLLADYLKKHLEEEPPHGTRKD